VNLTYNKGADSLIHVARKLKKNHATDVRFVICGEDRQGKKSRRRRTITDMAAAKGVAEYFQFMGHQRRPEKFILDSDVLIRPSRGNDPWGRDIIEAMSAGKPVLATGIYDKFIENGVNGYLFREFEEEAVAQKIIYLKTHPDVIEKMKQANLGKSRLLFDGRTNAGKIAALYNSLLEN
jgi:glycosyltransferase involved in cell wall biosynthesis